MERSKIAKMLPFLWAKLLNIISDMEVTFPSDHNVSKILDKLKTTKEFKLISDPVSEKTIGKLDETDLEMLGTTIRTIIPKTDEEKLALFKNLEVEMGKLKQNFPFWCNFIKKETGMGTKDFGEFYNFQRNSVDKSLPTESNKGSSPSLKFTINRTPNSKKNQQQPKKRKHARVNVIDDECLEDNFETEKPPSSINNPTYSDKENPIEVIESLLGSVELLKQSLYITESRTKNFQSLLENKKLKLEAMKITCSCDSRIQSQPFYQCQECSTFFHVCEGNNVLKIMATSKCETCSNLNSK